MPRSAGGRKRLSLALRVWFSFPSSFPHTPIFFACFSSALAHGEYKVTHYDNDRKFYLKFTVADLLFPEWEYQKTAEIAKQGAFKTVILVASGSQGAVGSRLPLASGSRGTFESRLPLASGSRGTFESRLPLASGSRGELEVDYRLRAAREGSCILIAACEPLAPKKNF